MAVGLLGVLAGISLQVADVCPVDGARLRAFLELENIQGASVALECALDRASLSVEDRGRRVKRTLSLAGRPEPERYLALVIAETVEASRRRLAEAPLAEREEPPEATDTATTARSRSEWRLGAGPRWILGGPRPLVGPAVFGGWRRGALGFGGELVFALGSDRLPLGSVDARALLGRMGPEVGVDYRALSGTFGLGVEGGALWVEGRPGARAGGSALAEPVFGPAAWIDVRVHVFSGFGLGASATLGHATLGAEATAGGEPVFGVDGWHGWVGASLDWAMGAPARDEPGL